MKRVIDRKGILARMPTNPHIGIFLTNTGVRVLVSYNLTNVLRQRELAESSELIDEICETLRDVLSRSRMGTIAQDN